MKKLGVGVNEQKKYYGNMQKINEIFGQFLKANTPSVQSAMTIQCIFRKDKLLHNEYIHEEPIRIFVVNNICLNKFQLCVNTSLWNL